MPFTHRDISPEHDALWARKLQRQKQDRGGSSLPPSPTPDEEGDGHQATANKKLSALLRRQEPASILARRYGVSTKTLGQWKDDFIAAGTSGLTAGKRQAGDNAKRLAVLESAVAERDRVIGELTIANVILTQV